MNRRAACFLTLLAVLTLAGLDAWAAEKPRSAPASKTTPSLPTARGSEPSPERIRDLKATIAIRKKKRARSARLRTANQARADAQMSALPGQGPGGGSPPDSTGNTSTMCLDCGAVFNTQPYLSLPAGLDLSHGVRLSVLGSMHR